MSTGNRPAPSSDDEGASCWICLEEGPDENGQPLARDCSCRGNSGFAHLACMVNYVEQLCCSVERHSGTFLNAWTNCPNCHQCYENELMCDLVVEAKLFVERKYPGDLWYLSHASYLKLRSLSIKKGNKDNAVQTANELLSLVEQMEKARKNLRKFRKALLYFQVTAYESIALFAEMTNTKESLMDAVEHHTKARDTYKKIGIPTDVVHAEANITRAKSKLNGDNGWTAEDLLKDSQEYYNESLEETGEESSVTLSSLIRLAEALKGAKRGIESERMLVKLAVVARRVHGDTHVFTHDVEKTLERYKKRYVFIKGEQGKRFQALRYVDGEDKCVVQGPITKPRNIEEEKTFTVHIDEFRPALGSLVICHGLKGSESHLNGKIGEMRSRMTGAQQYRVYFEDKNLEPCLVGPKNVRILFELPPSEF